MGSDDVGLKLCQQHVIKLDFEIKALIQVCISIQFSVLPALRHLVRLC